MKVTVWRCDLDREFASLDMLDDYERMRAAAFAFEHLRRRYAAAHVFLRSVLSQGLRIAPEEVRFAVTAHGKPYLDSPTHSLAFNMTHADGVAYVAIASTGEIGIDVELHHDIDDLMNVARTVFSPIEVAQLESAVVPSRTSMFLHCWTRKEAYVKALGVGLGARLCDITVGHDPVDLAVPPLAAVSAVPFYVRSLNFSANEYVAIATTEPIGQVDCRSFN